MLELLREKMLHFSDSQLELMKMIGKTEVIEVKEGVEGVEVVSVAMIEEDSEVEIEVVTEVVKEEEEAVEV